MALEPAGPGVALGADASPRRRAALWAAGVAGGVAAGVGIALDSRIVALAAVGVAAAFTVRGFESVLHVLALSVFVESVVVVGPARIGRVLAAVAVGAVVLRLLFTDWRPPRLRASAWMPAAVFGLWATASGFWARDLGPWAFSLGELGLAGAYFLAFALLPGSDDELRRVLRTYAWGAVGAAALGLSQATILPGILLTGQEGRAVGLQGDANLYAMYQAMALPVVLVLGRTATGRARAAWYLSAVPLAASVLASQSRGGLLTLAVAAALPLARRDDAFVPAPSRRLAAMVAVAGVAAFGVAAAAVLQERIAPERIAKDRGSARIDIWFVAWKQSLREPVLGLGGGNFRSHSIELLEREPGVQLEPGHHILKASGIETHNAYLETLVDYGVPGLALYVTILGGAAAGLVRVGRRIRTGRALPVMLAAFCTGTIFLSVVHNKLLWICVGLAAAYARPAPDPV